MGEVDVLHDDGHIAFQPQSSEQYLMNSMIAINVVQTIILILRRVMPSLHLPEQRAQCWYFVFYYL
jgi:hypothetical protein